MITQKQISVYCIPGLIGNKTKDMSYRRPTIEEVVDLVSKKEGVSVNEMRSKSRIQSIVEARQIATYICCKMINPNYTSSKVGKYFFQNHATALHGIKQVNNLKYSDKEFQHRIILISQYLNL